MQPGDQVLFAGIDGVPWRPEELDGTGELRGPGRPGLDDWMGRFWVTTNGIFHDSLPEGKSPFINIYNR